jgi:hypothetical protein
MLKMEVLEEKLDCPPIQKERERDWRERKNEFSTPSKWEIGWKRND